MINGQWSSCLYLWSIVFGQWSIVHEFYTVNHLKKVVDLLGIINAHHRRHRTAHQFIEIGHLHLLETLYPGYIVPEAVFAELQNYRRIATRKKNYTPLLLISEKRQVRFLRSKTLTKAKGMHHVIQRVARRCHSY